MPCVWFPTLPHFYLIKMSMFLRLVSGATKDSEQWYDNVDGTPLVLASSKLLVLRKAFQLVIKTFFSFRKHNRSLLVRRNLQQRTRQLRQYSQLLERRTKRSRLQKKCRPNSRLQVGPLRCAFCRQIHLHHRGKSLQHLFNESILAR